jgi:hypothetical protein
MITAPTIVQAVVASVESHKNDGYPHSTGG